MGAWIEIIIVALITGGLSVAPLVGAWIEMLGTMEQHRGVVSLLSWERGLKLVLVYPLLDSSCRSSRGSVD